MTTITVRQPAGPGERFAEGCFDSSIGKDIPLNGGGGAAAGTQCKVISVEIVEGGAAALLTLDVPPSAMAAIEIAPGSFGFAR